MEPELRPSFPGSRRIAPKHDDPSASSRFDWLPTGFHAIILSPAVTVLIDPYAQAIQKLHNVLEEGRGESGRAIPMRFHRPRAFPGPARSGLAPAVTSGTQLRTYRLALACTVEYATAVGSNTVAAR